ncbi:hypothetical protein ACHAP5_003413 [Fusarium lateritium]
MPSPSQNSFRIGLRRRLNRLRRQSNDRSSLEVSVGDSPTTARAARGGTFLFSDQAGEGTELDRTATPLAVVNSAPRNVSGCPPTANSSSAFIVDEVTYEPGTGQGVADTPSDLWSNAYREAVQNLGQDVDLAILEGENIAQLFKELERVDKDATDESEFLRGVRYLTSIQVPLERFKLALDLTRPLTALEPTTSAVFGIIRGVTAAAISISTADLEFAKRIGDMLEQISYIDDCDIVGQKGDRADALVLVYQKLLEFYVSAHRFLSKKRTRLVLAVISDMGTLPDIVKDFLEQADHLRRIVEKATFDIVQDIKTMLYNEKISQWLGHGKLTQQSRHHADLQSLRAVSACNFILQNPEFKTWYRASGSQQLVVLGDMGTGKSVLASFLIDELCRRTCHQLPQPMLLYHYCQNDETGHALYIFSSLILSLLEQCVGQKRAFFDWYKQDLLSGNFQPSTNVHKLVGFFQRTVRELDRQLLLVVDGLDECDTKSRNMFLEALQDLVQNTTRLKVVLSCRPCGEILNQLEGIPKINMSTDTDRDKAIAEKTVETELAYLTADIKQLVVERLSTFAQGSAIWTKMTVASIAAQKIWAPGRMKKFLDDMPQPRKLSELYTNLLIQCAGEETEAQNMAATALQILGAARRRLSVLELAWAVALAIAGPHVSTVAEVAELADSQSVMSHIQPFVTSVDIKDLKKRQVSVVHQSVKEFIVDGFALSRPSNEGGKGNTAALLTTSKLENNIFNICVRYLLLDEINNISLFSDEQAAIMELPQDLESFNDNDAATYTTDCSWEAWEEGMIQYDPADRGFGEFFIYASCYWIDHFGSVVAQPLPDLRSVEKLCHANSTRLRNWTSQNSRPDCVLQARFDFDSSLYDPLSITSLYGSEVLLLKMLEMSDFDSCSFLPNTAMLTVDLVLQWGDLNILRMLFFGRGTGRHLQNLEFFRYVVDSWRLSKKTYSQDWDAAFGIINDIPHVLADEGWGNDLFYLAVSQGCLPVIELLVGIAQQNIDLRRELLRGPQRQLQDLAPGVHQSIREADPAGHFGIIGYVLGQEDL